MTRHDVRDRLLCGMASPWCGTDGEEKGAGTSRLLSLARDAWERAIVRDFPVLMAIWAADAVGRPSPVTLDAAAAWSGLYLAAKLLDDLQDGDPGILGSEVRVSSVLNLATSLVFAAQWCIANGANGSDDESSLRTRLARELSRCSLEVAEGQELGMQVPPEGEAALAWAWEVLRGKGARPFALACRVGAISGGATPAAVDVMTELGHCIGEAVQLLDDALGLQARDLSDLRLVSIPLAYALSVADEEDSRSLAALVTAIGEGDTGAAEPLCTLLENMGAMRYVSISTSASVVRARELLSSPLILRASAGAQALADVVEWLDPATGSPSSPDSD